MATEHKAFDKARMSRFWGKVKTYVASAISGLYTKPSGGIPKTDLADSVQTSLGKADTALQSFTESDPTVPAWAKQTLKPTYTAQEVGALPAATNYAGSQSVGGAANKAVSIPFGQVDSTSTNTAFTAQVDGITELRDGVCVWLRNGVVNSTTGCTLDINGLGAKPMYSSISSNSRITTHFNAGYTILFVYNSTRVEGGCWDFVVGYDTNNNDTAWVVRRSGGQYTNKETLYPSVICFKYSETELLPVSRTSTIQTSKELTTLDFDPFGDIVVYIGTTAQVGTLLDMAHVWLQRAIDIRYSFNVTNLTESKSVYAKCVPVVNNGIITGRVTLETTQPCVQELPNSEDGFVYIFLGRMQTSATLQLSITHPIYYYKDGAIRQWTNQDTTALKLGTSTIGGTTQGVYLNQGVPAACESYDMWYMKHIAALYGATRNDATGLWSYYYTNCARWDDTQEKIVWDRSIGYDDITDAEMMSMVEHRLQSLAGVYGFCSSMNSRIGFHFRGYGNNVPSSSKPSAYLNNSRVITYGYIGRELSGQGGMFIAIVLADVGSVDSNVRHLIGRVNSTENQVPVNNTVLKYLEYFTASPAKNGQIFDYSSFSNIEFVSVMYTVTNPGGSGYTGCTLKLHPDVYAKIFDSTNADYTLWHKIDVANQARTNPITIQSA